MRTPTNRFLTAVAAVGLLLVVTFAILHFTRERGQVVTAEYDSMLRGGKQRLRVYLPPDYPNAAPYPVLYLLHGAGDDEASWQAEGSADYVLDDLYSIRQIVPMVVVMPNAQRRGSLFERDLLEEVIPYAESHCAAATGARSRAIAGVSLGGGQALSIGLKHPDRFAWVGGFSPSLAGKMEDVVMEQLANPPSGSEQRRLLWLSCGNADQIKAVSESLHATLAAKQISHVWHVGAGEHEWVVWKEDLRRFAPLLFR